MPQDGLQSRVFFVILFFITGCAKTPILVSIDRITVGDVVEPFRDGSVARWPADPNRLVDDVGRALRDLHWGRLYLRRVPEKGQKLQFVRSAAMLDDGRTATIVAWPVGADQIGVAVRVGIFGDRMQEQSFVNMLAAILEGKPKPKRGPNFEMPDEVDKPSDV